MFNANMVAHRHKINIELEISSSSSNTLITSIPNLNSVASLVTSNNMNTKNKYNAAFRIAQEIANKAKSLKQNEFKNAMEQLTRMNEFFSNKIEFKLVPCDEKDVTLKNNEADLFDTNNDDEIKSSQSSTISVDSYFVANKNISMGTSVGRKKSQKRKTDHSIGQLTSYLLCSSTI